MAVSNVSSSSASKINMNSSTIKSSGLVSGLDTETLVKQMSALTKSKINGQMQKVQLLQWKQDAYRSAITKISTLKDTYFNSLNPSTNLTSNSLFGAMTATSTNSSVKVTASANAVKTTYNVTNVIKKATTASVQSSSRAVEGIKLDFSAAVDGQQYKVNVTLDGLTKEIAFTGGADSASTQANLINALNTQFSTSTAKFKMVDNRLVTTDATYTSITHTFSIAATTASAGDIKAIGLSSNVSSNISVGTKLSDIAFGEKLSGDGYTFEINSVKFSFDKNSTLKDVMDTINNSSAGVKVSFESLSGKFKIESTSSGIASNLAIKQTSGNLLSSMLGESTIGHSSSLSSASMISGQITGIKPDAADAFVFADGSVDMLGAVTNAKVSVTVNGVTKEIGLWGYDSSGVKNNFTKASAVTTQLNAEMTKQFGSNAPTFTYDKTTKTFSLSTNTSGDVVSIKASTDTSGASQKLVAALGFNATNSTNDVDTNAKLSELIKGDLSGTISFGSSTVTLDNNTTIKDLVDGSNGYVTFENGKLTLTGVDITNTDTQGEASLVKLFGYPPYNYPGIPPTQMTTEFSSKGENGIISVNGVDITSSTNSYTIDGTTIDVSALGVGATDFSVTTLNDTSKAMDAVKKFVDDYNKLISDLNTETSTKYDKDYPPLTEEQKADMSEKQISDWEAKAKVGMLYQDSTVENFLTSIRSALVGKNSSGLSLVDIGITTSSVYQDNGKLIIDQTKLQNAFNTNPEGVQKLFTNQNDGISTKVNAAIDYAVKTTGSTKGTLVNIAGVANTTSAAENSITKQLAQYKTTIESLQTKYENEQDRYWKQFTNLETTLSKLNSQSSWLASQFSTGQ